MTNAIISLGLLALSTAVSVQGADPLKALIIDGQNNYGHRWAQMTPIIRDYLEDLGLFEVAVATTPPKGADMNGFKPDFSGLDVVILNNYDADPWPEETSTAFEQFVRNGGGFVSVHSTDNAFTDWKEFQEMIGVGGWGGRTAESGPYVRWRDGKQMTVQAPGNSGHHGPQHEYILITRAPDHEVMRDLPESWRHSKDELYDCLRGPARNLTVLATAYSAPDYGGTSEHEPMLMVINYGKGRVFHTTLGHSPEAMQCVGFATTLQRGAEWAATGNVTQPLPENFPTEDNISIRPKPALP